MNTQDIKMVSVGSAGYFASIWHSVEPVLQAIIVIGTAGYVVLRLWDKIREMRGR